MSENFGVSGKHESRPFDKIERGNEVIVRNYYDTFFCVYIYYFFLVRRIRIKSTWYH
jgi:hypothetical protein